MTFNNIPPLMQEIVDTLESHGWRKHTKRIDVLHPNIKRRFKNVSINIRGLTFVKCYDKNRRFGMFLVATIDSPNVAFIVVEYEKTSIGYKIIYESGTYKPRDKIDFMKQLAYVNHEWKAGKNYQL